MSDEREDRTMGAIGAIGSTDTMSGSDTDLELITDYLAGELDAHNVATVERRLRSDEAFRRRAEPLMAAWRLREEPEPMPVMDDRTAMADLWRRIREQEESAAGVETPRLQLVAEAALTDSPAIAEAPWWEVLPPTWMARVAILGTLGVAGLGWLAYAIVTHRCHCL